MIVKYIYGRHVQVVKEVAASTDEGDREHLILINLLM